jgi:hypothetical protein
LVGSGTLIAPASYDPLVSEETTVDELLGPRADEFFEQTGIAAVPPKLAQEFRDLVDVSPVPTFEQALNYLEGRFLGWGGEPPLLMSATDLRYLQEIERWNIAGLAFLRSEYANLASIFYERLLLHVRGLQGLARKRLHKGTPYHMLGVSKVMAQQLSEARDYFTLAAFEDALLSEDWRSAPAATMLAPSAWNLATWSSDVGLGRVQELVNRARSFGNETEREWVVVSNPELLLLIDRAD